MQTSVIVIRGTALYALAWLAAAPSGGQPAQSDGGHDWAKLSGEAREVRFETLSRAEGIPTDRVFQVLQDRRGFTWLTTVSGLYRWDGYQSVRYPGLPIFRPYYSWSGAPGVLFEARDGKLWVASDVVTPFDPSVGKFGPPLNPLSRPPQPLNDAVTGFFEDSDGTLWLGVSTYQFEGAQRTETSEPVLYQINPITSERIAHPIDPKILQGRPASIRAIEKDRHGRFWLGTSIGLIRFDLQSGSFQYFPHQHTGEATLPFAQFNALIWDKTGHLWVHQPSGIERFDPDTGVFDRFTAAPFRYIRADPSGRFWLSFGHPPAMVFDPYEPAENALKVVSYRAPGSPAEQITFTMMDPDRQGNIWAYLNGAGIVRYSPAVARFGKHLPEWSNPNSLNGRLVTGIAGNPDGSVWISTAYNGLALFDPRSDSFRQFHHDPKRPDGLDAEWVTSVYVDRSESVWVATAGGHLGTFDHKSGRFRMLRDYPMKGAIYSMFEDSTDRLWVSSGNGETRAIGVRTRTWLPEEEIQAYVTREDRDGNLWFGFEPGLTKLDRTGKMRTIPLPVPESNPMLQPRVYSIYIDGSGIFWLGSIRGLFRFDPRTEKSTRYAMNEGLPIERVVCVLPDGDGNLWVSTARGISRFNMGSGRFYNYDERDGLQQFGFSPFACATASDGRLYFGGSTGFNAFYPRDILSRATDTRVVLTSLQIKDRAVPVVGLERISLPHHRNDLSLEFAALNVINPGNLIYRFRLEPQEQSWIETDSAHRGARYTGLVPGDYLFRSQVSTDGRTWSDREASLRIIVTSPWWGTWWARIAAVLLFAGVLAGSYKARVRALQQRERQLSELVDQRTAELVAARDRAQAASQAKSNFLANMSHELRTPLHAILGFSSLLRSSANSGEQRDRLDIINRSGEHLLTLINDVLDVAKIEAGKQELAIAPCDLKSLVHDVTEMMRDRAKAQGLALICHRSPEFPEDVRTDGPKLRQVLVNLLGNAVKYTERGSVTLRLSATPMEEANRMCLQFEVADTGIGISSEDQARIFEPFVQVGRPGKQEGTGLGLTITRSFIKMMGGTLSLVSAPGEGSIFTVQLPAELTAEHPDVRVGTDADCRVSLTPGQPEWRVLAVDDNQDNLLLLSDLLFAAGFQVRTAENGPLAIEAFSLFRPHFIFMDLRMPVMGGAEAAHRIRGLEGGSQAKIAAITASAYASEREEVMANGMDDIIRKPFRSPEIFDCIARHLPVRYSRVQRASAAPAAGDGQPSVASLHAISDTLRTEFAQAVVSLNRERIAATIAKIGKADPELAAALRSLHDRFAYTAMLELIEEAHSDTHRS